MQMHYGPGAVGTWNIGGTFFQPMDAHRQAVDETRAFVSRRRAPTGGAPTAIYTASTQRLCPPVGTQAVAPQQYREPFPDYWKAWFRTRPTSLGELLGLGPTAEFRRTFEGPGAQRRRPDPTEWVGPGAQRRRPDLDDELGGELEERRRQMKKKKKQKKKKMASLDDVSCHVMTCQVTSRHVTSRHVMSCHVASCHVMSCRVVSCRVMSCIYIHVYIYTY